MNSYFRHINQGIRTTLAGMKITLRHLWNARSRRSQNNILANDYFNESNGMVTLQYPLETMPIPDHGRYRLHNEMDDCIVCDKCAKICPVDCIEIEPIKATEEIGKASDGSPIRLYAAKFDIDMAKCCYCGLCTTVCPTECLTMTKTFDYSEFDIREMNYHFANLTPEQAAEKQALYEQFVREKEEFKRISAVPKQVDRATEQPPETPKPKPVFKPTAKPPVSTLEDKPTPATEPQAIETPAATPRPKPVFKPTTKPPAMTEEKTTEVEPTENKNTDHGAAATPRPKPVFKPTMKPKTSD
ncbi:MAG: 4Fe-4S binding protein [Runella sp.]